MFRYQFTTGSKFAIFTFQGCTVQVSGKMEVEPYTSKETPMMIYLNTHAALEQLRQKAEKDETNKMRGPICMLVTAAKPSQLERFDVLHVRSDPQMLASPQ